MLVDGPRTRPIPMPTVNKGQDHGPRQKNFTNAVNNAQRQSAAPRHEIANPRQADLAAEAVARAHAHDSADRLPQPRPEIANPTQADLAAKADRRREIDRWVKTKATDNAWNPFGDDAHDKVANALRDKSELGRLDDDEKRYLVDKALDKWLANDDTESAADLAAGVGDNGHLGQLVAQRYAMRAAKLIQEAGANSGKELDLQKRALELARSALTATGSPVRLKRDVNETGVRNMILSLSPQQAGYFARALAQGGDSQRLSAILRALDGAPVTETTREFVGYAFASVNDVHYHEPSGDLAEAMGNAIARQTYADPKKQAAEGRRLGEILATSQGRDLLHGDGSVPPMARLQALNMIRENPQITAKTVQQSGAGWTNPQVMKLFAQAQADRYQQMRGDDPQTLRGTHLENTVGFTMGLPPQVPKHETPTQAEKREAATARGEYSYYKSGKGVESVHTVVEAIRKAGGDSPAVTILPIQYSSPQTGPVQLPLFRVNGADGRERYVDNTGKTYESFGDWKNNNVLPAGNVTYPTGGRLTAGNDGHVKLESGNTHKTLDTPGEYITSAADVAALAGGIVAGGAIILGTGGTAAPVVIGVASAAWTAYRTGSSLHDQAQHGQSIDPRESAQARSDWINLGASVFTAGAFGSSLRVAGTVARGVEVSPLLASGTRSLGWASTAADAVATGNTGYELAVNWDELTPGQRAEMGLSMAFWGVSAAATRVSTRNAAAEAFDLAAKGPDPIKPVNGRVNVGGGLETPDMTNLNPIKAGSGGPSKGIPNHVRGSMEQMGEIFERGSVEYMMSNKLPYAGVDWPVATRAAAQAMKPGGKVDLNIWGLDDNKIAALKSGFEQAGFKNVEVVGEGVGSRLQATR
jgi:hypothetical protein